jgi:hypothetical protein
MQIFCQIFVAFCGFLCSKIFDYITYTNCLLSEKAVKSQYLAASNIFSEERVPGLNINTIGKYLMITEALAPHSNVISLNKVYILFQRIKLQF